MNQIIESLKERLTTQRQELETMHIDAQNELKTAQARCEIAAQEYFATCDSTRVNLQKVKDDYETCIRELRSDKSRLSRKRRLWIQIDWHFRQFVGGILLGQAPTLPDMQQIEEQRAREAAQQQIETILHMDEEVKERYADALFDVAELKSILSRFEETIEMLDDEIVRLQNATV